MGSSSIRKIIDILIGCAIGAMLGAIFTSLLITVCGHLLPDLYSGKDFDGLGAFGIHIIMPIGLTLGTILGVLSYGFGSRRMQWYVFSTFTGAIILTFLTVCFRVSIVYIHRLSMGKLISASFLSNWIPLYIIEIFPISGASGAILGAFIGGKLKKKGVI